MARQKIIIPSADDVQSIDNVVESTGLIMPDGRSVMKDGTGFFVQENARAGLLAAPERDYVSLHPIEESNYQPTGSSFMQLLRSPVVQNIGKIAAGLIAATGVAAIVSGGDQHVHGDTINALDMVSNATYSQAIPDPQAGAWGTIVGADAIKGGSEFVVLYSNGGLSFFNDSAGMLPTTPYNSVALASGNPSGVSEINKAIYGADLAVSSNTGISLFDYDGTLKGGLATDLNNITDITYDWQRDRVIVSHPTSGNNIVNADGTHTILIGGNPTGIEAIDLDQSATGAPFNDLFQQGPAFYGILPAGTTDGFKMTNLAQGFSIQGIAYTQNHAIMAVDQGLVVYDKQQFQDFINHGTAVPEPSALLIGGAALAMMAGYRSSKRQNRE